MKRKLRVRFDLIEADPEMSDYRKGGEYRALLWLKAYSERRASAEPLELLAASIRASSTFGDRNYNAAFMETILRYAQ